MAESPSATIPDGYTALAVVGLVNKGTYESSKSYKKYDFVYEASTHSSYVALMDVSSSEGSTPLSSDTTHWQLLAQGVVGAAAGFGQITAEIQQDADPISTIGTAQPSVEVKTDGDNTAKNITFTFKNLKGDKGEQGETGQRGEQGIQGTTGAKGDTGAQGLSVTNLTVSSDNHLKYRLSATAPAESETDVDAGQIDMTGYVKESTKGQASGVASLDTSSRVPENQLPQIKEIIHETLVMATWKQSETTDAIYPQWTYDLTVDGLNTSHLVFVHAPMGLTVAQINGFADAGITAKDQQENKIILQALNKPTMDLPIVIEISAVTVAVTDKTPAK